ncbi:GATA-type zinc finger protein 1 isoform X2 [Oryctolagus cuniculus]|nr:GATA-type zinc finger protein 1 [Oryctolagus cuniculus]
MEAKPATGFVLRELLAPGCLDPKPTPGPPAGHEPMTPACLGPRSRLHFWRVCKDPVSALRVFRERPPRLPRPPGGHAQALGPGWEPMALGTEDPLPLARAAEAIQGSASACRQKCLSLEPPRAPPAPPQRRPRKQPEPRRGMEKADPQFQGVTLNFAIKPDASLQITPSYSPAHGSSRRRTQEPPPGPAGGPEANPPGGSEMLGPRRCASCRTQRTPLWRDAEDGTPLCNACGIRYKKYGTRCSRCWLVPRKSVQPRRLCGRCGVSQGSRQGPAQDA